MANNGWGNSNTSWNNQQQSTPVADDNKALGFDDTIEDTDQFVLLTPGAYDFKVTKADKGYYNGSEKMMACNTIDLEIAVYDPASGQEVTISKKFFLTTKSQWQIAQFYISIGLMQPKGQLKMQWNNVIGRTGKVEVKHREYNGNKYNDVSKFLAPVQTQGNWGN